jgi:hypothetical protein
MNISNSLRQNYVFPAAGFLPFPDTDGYTTYKDTETMTAETPLPKNSDSAKPEVRRWRVDGATFGTQFWVAPDFVHPMIPKRVDLSVPDQTKWPSGLRSFLNAKESVHMSDGRAAHLGISRHIAQALEQWSESHPDFLETYLALPFGSSINVPKVEADTSNMQFDLVPNYKLYDRMLSAESLRQMWKFDTAEMPPCISLDQLNLQKQLQKSITLVTIETSSHSPMMIFKSRTRTMSGLYHEVKVLLTIPPHPNIIRRPLYLVTTRQESSQEPRVCGMLLEYHEQGALQDALPQRLQSKSLSLHSQTRWAKEVTKALIHVHSTKGQFYSDLKMDNVLLATDGDKETAILADFEQSRNFYNWAPPEIYYIEWISELGYADMARTSIDVETRDRYAAAFERYLQSKGQSSLQVQGSTYDNPPHGWYFPWTLSTSKEQEAGVVYCLGKVIWCIFEGLGEADNILGRSIPFESEQRFPEFRRTPEELRGLVKRCTVGAREWKDGPISIFRNGGTVYPLGRTGRNGEPKGTLEETKEAIKAFWQGEMRKAETFMAAKEKYDVGEADEHDKEKLDYLSRPTLEEVLSSLEGYATSLL